MRIRVEKAEDELNQYKDLYLTGICRLSSDISKTMDNVYRGIYYGYIDR